jgi:transposase
MSKLPQPMTGALLPLLTTRIAESSAIEGVMNFGWETVASRYSYSKTIPKRRLRRRVGVCSSVSGTRSRRRTQRNHDLREVFNGLRWVVRTGSPWRYMPYDLPPWEAVYQQTQRWFKAGVFEEMVHDLRVLLRLSEGGASDPTAAILDSRTLRSTPESGSRSGYDGAKRKKGSKVHAAVDTLGHLLALRVNPANE